MGWDGKGRCEEGRWERNRKAKEGKRREAESDIGSVKEQEKERERESERTWENVSEGHRGLTSSEMLLEE